MGWTKHPTGRSKELPPNWKQIRRQVINREHGQCQFLNPNTGNRCPERGTEVHHTNRWDHNPDSLALLCHFHHARITAIQATQGRIAARKRREATRKHPGLK